MGLPGSIICIQNRYTGGASLGRRMRNEKNKFWLISEIKSKEVEKGKETRKKEEENMEEL